MTQQGIEETLSLAGLGRRAEIRVDTWGIAHIRAENERDLFLVQGFNAARDRLWQLDLWRKRGLGLLAADFGPGYLAQDLASRHFLYRGNMESEWISYAVDAQAICTAFVDGINAYISLCERDTLRLPPEFAFFGTRPAAWRPEDVVRIRTHAMSRNAVSEVLRANVTTLADSTVDLLRFELDPPAEPKPANGISLAEIPLQALRLLKLATAPVTFDQSRLSASLEQAWRWVEVSDLGCVVAGAIEDGSNSWAVHGSRTATGRPILASDPHRSITSPSVRYLVHLEAPGLNIVGAGEPTAPGISLGHNERVAFGLTIFCADQEDVYVYETREGDAEYYRYGSGWEKIERIDEHFEVKGYPKQILTLSFTRHGPVLFENNDKRQVIAVRSIWSSPGAAPYLGSLSYMRSGSVREFAETLSSWGAPSVNHVCADVDGNIAWLTAGFTPVRPNWEGLLPVPGDGSHEWDGFLSPGDMPHKFNPKEGFVASANEMNLTKGDTPRAAPIGYEWPEVSRAERIRSWLHADESHTLYASMALQTDLYSRPAFIICKAFAEVALRSALNWRQHRAWALLCDWNHHVEVDSVPAALFEVWWMRHLRPALVGRFVQERKVRELLLPGDSDRMLRLLAEPGTAWNDVERDSLMLSTLEAAFSDCELCLGHNPEAWRWGDLHRAHFVHAAGSINRGQWDVGPLPVAGSGSTVMLATYGVRDFKVSFGASVRIVCDVGNWDNSKCINAPGQSGDPRSAHYADLADRWSRGQYVPLLYSEAQIAAETSRKIELLPL